MAADLQGLGGELDADGGPGLEAELVPGEPRQQVVTGLLNLNAISIESPNFYWFTLM